MKTFFPKILTLIVSALVIMWYAFYNGFPLATSDTGAYVSTAFDFAVLKDRSSFYSVFLAYTGVSLSHISAINGTLWLPVFFQSAIIAFLFTRIFYVLSGKAPQVTVFLFSTTIIAFGTGVSWVASYIMPDIFVGILLVAIVVYLFDRQANKTTRIIYALIIIVSIIVHNSHFLLILFWCAAIGVITYKNFEVRRKVLHIVALAMFCIITMCSLNYSKGFGFVLSPGSHVFLMGKLAETNVLQTYLKENCDTKESALCPYKDEIQESAIEYLWADNSPFKKIGGWEGSRYEHMKIIKGVFTTPRYILLYAKKALAHSLEQLGNFQISTFEQPFNKGTSPYNNIEKYIPTDLPQLVTAAQQHKTINNQNLKYIHLLILLASTIWVILVYRRVDNKQTIKGIYCVIITYIICNATVTASLANVLDRLQYRVFWVLPATNIIIVINYYLNRRLPITDDN